MFNRTEEMTSEGSAYRGIPRYGYKSASGKKEQGTKGFKQRLHDADSSDWVPLVALAALVALVVFVVAYFSLHKSDGNPDRAEAISSMCVDNPTQYRVFTEDAFSESHVVGRQYVVGYKNKGDEWVPVSTKSLVETSGPVLTVPTAEGEPKGTEVVKCDG